MSSRRTSSPATLGLRMALASGLIALLCVYAWRPGRPVTVSEQRVEAPFVPSMTAVPAPPPLPTARLGLAEAGLDPARVSARFDPRTGQREDTLTRGDFATDETPALRVTLTRGPSPGPVPTLFVLMARRAAGGPVLDGPALSVVRTGARGLIATKFGAVETLEVTFGGAARRTCTGFVTRNTETFRLDGWACAPLGHPPRPESLACTLDALSLVDLSDPGPTAAFAAAPERVCPSVVTVGESAGRTGSIAKRSQNKK
ncbi:hypothetical protein MMSR116_07335 [Methylobacterium mesophilicum SR1.6/6]|uniref:Uncharacterized protein n=1 Tax=Methylobacterium mesophilicum SR1.6/6 TaxID=908290 RepID=A0A6B9FTX2_9HYPH|nr:hypothetical protein MMSR116_07335 [Methylobacterium mesophilicum SR1.6/6]